MSKDCGVPTRGRSITKKALLIGIAYHTRIGRQGQKLEYKSIPTSVPNVRAFESFLRESQGYTDITVMTDEEGVEERYQPTKSNLKREIEALGSRVQPGDRRVFYFAGHSDQMPCKTGSEEDGMDEVLVALGGKRIRDNKLKNLLVRGLPKGSALTAIFDSCTSGTLLDLEHYKCNNVYRPWVNKGGRRSHTLRNYVVRRDCRSTQTRPPSLPGSKHKKGSCSPLMLPTEDPDPDRHSGKRTTSPERQFVCDGLCRAEQMSVTPEHGDVISISSSNDGQTSWDASTTNGGSVSMTTFLIDILKKHPGISISGLMTRLNHKVHSFTTGMHDYAQKESRARRKGDGKKTDSEDTESEEERKEMNNFQDLQLGSTIPVDMDRPFII